MGRIIIKGGTIVEHNGVRVNNLVIENETIAYIGPSVQPTLADQVIDASGMLVLPGIIDAHTHIQLDTGIYRTADDWEIGTKAAAAGGVTTVIDFANQIAGETFETALKARMADAANALIDYTFHMVVLHPPRDAGALQEDLNSIMALGLPSIKLFTTYRPNYYVDDADLLRIFQCMPDGMLAMIHAENDSIVTDATQGLATQGHTGWRYHAKGRPAVAEEEAVNRVLFFAGQTGASVYVAHCTSPVGIEAILQAKASGAKVACETCPQYLLLDDSVYEGEHPEHYILQPPIRSKVLRDAPPTGRGLWDQLADIDVISTDSCDYTLDQKVAFTDFVKTPGGLPGIETLLPLTYTYAVEDRAALSLSAMVAKLSTNPAKIFGIYPQKGSLQPGSDADIVLYNPAPETQVDHRKLHYMAGYSPYQGMRIKGRVHMTISRGETVYDAGDFPVAPGRGKFVHGQIS